MPYLSGIYTEPSLNVTPAFKVETIEYYTTVPYNMFLVKVWGFAQSCDCEARLDDKYGLSRYMLNLSLIIVIFFIIIYLFILAALIA